MIQDDGTRAAVYLDVEAWGQYSDDPRSATRRIRFRVTSVEGFSLEREIHEGLEQRGLQIRRKDLRFVVYPPAIPTTVNLHSWRES